MGCIEKSIESICTQLKSKLKYNEWNSKDFCWEYKNDTHIISAPPRNDVEHNWDLFFLHEHIHALHKEQFPEIFSINPDPNQLSFGFNYEVNYYFNAARDWFILGNLINYCPIETKKFIEHDFHSTKVKLYKNMTIKDQLIIGLSLAQSKLFLNESIDSILELTVEKVINSFLRINPKAPNISTLYKLTSDLFDIFGYFKLTLIDKNSSHKWDIEQLKELPQIKKETNLEELFERFNK